MSPDAPGRHERLWLVAATLLPLGVYLRTAYPGLVGTADTPRLQLVGSVLGTAHTPGYPLYSLLAHVFSWLPFGTPAWRANLMSAVFGALAAGLCLLVSRRLGAGSAASLAAALGLAFAPVFWSQSLLAEVYTLAAFLLLGTLLGLVAWTAERRDGALVGAAAFFGLALAHHHVDIVVALPAIAFYLALAGPPRPSTRVTLAALAAVGFGVGLYGFILLRTLQGAPYLATAATSLAELAQAIRGKAFTHQLFAFDIATLLWERVPRVAGLVARELGPVGLPLVLAGAVALARTRGRELALLGLAALGNLVFALNYDAGDLHVFVLPAIVALWPLAGAGLEAFGRALPAQRTLALGLAALLPVTQLVMHYRASDHHLREIEDRYFDALFASLPDGATLLRESDLVDSMLLYKILAEDAAGARQIQFFPGDPAAVGTALANRSPVYAFRATRDRLSERGYAFAPLPLPDAPLAAYLARQRAGTLVLLAGTATDAPDELRAALRVIGVERPEGAGPVFAAMGRVGGSGTAELHARRVSLEVAAGEHLGTTGIRAETSLQALATEGAALLRIDGLDVARVEGGVALAILGSRGRVVERIGLDAGTGLLVPFPPGAWPLDILTGDRTCQHLPEESGVPLETELFTGRLLIRETSGAVVYAGASTPLSPRLASPRDAGPTTIRVEAFGPGDAALAAALVADGLDQDAVGAAHVVRVELSGMQGAVGLDLGGQPESVQATATSAAEFCALPVGGEHLFVSPRGRIKLDLGRRGLPFLGHGWAPERAEDAWIVRPSAGPEADVWLSLQRPRAISVVADVRDAQGDGTGGLELLVNGASQSQRELGAEWSTATWKVPLEAWRSGSNLLRWRHGAGGRFELRRLHLSAD